MRDERGSATVATIFRARAGGRRHSLQRRCERPAFEEQHDYVSIALSWPAPSRISSAGAGDPAAALSSWAARARGPLAKHGAASMHRAQPQERYEELLAGLGAAKAGMNFPRVALPVSTRGAALFARTEAFASGHASGSAHELALSTVSWVVEALGRLGRNRAPTSAQTQSMLAVARAIDADVSGDHSVQTLAAMASMSSFHFIRCFKRVVGTTPHAYVRIARLRSAGRFCDPKLPIAAVAFEVGFQDLSVLNHAFRQTFGVTPRQLRASLAS